MTRDPRYDILFEPVAIGPVTAKNRFYQVPHCNGMGHQMPRSVAAMRGIKAEGGWAVVSTEECDIHASTDELPYHEARLWDDRDASLLALTADAIHQHDALAAIELTHNGHAVSNRYSRLPPMSVSDTMCLTGESMQAYAMSKKDIAAVRRWHRQAALRAKQAGFDIVYVYAGHNLALPMHFLSRRYNRRSDEYGGKLENRARLLRELLEDTKDAIGDSCGVALRFAVDELLEDGGLSSDGESRDVVAMLAELPDLWDVNVSDWPNDSVTSKFAEEGYQESFVGFVKQTTTKPVVGVGRFTSPDTMVAQIKRGVLDMIGAARPSIADPFLPQKIEQGHIEDIRECIGCNICVTGDWMQVPIRCTQNPTMGEEYRRGWHPEIIAKKQSADRILIIGGGPAGLEAAMALGKRGYSVTLAEACEQLGGRVALESQLPGLASWKRVVDYRVGQLEKLNNVEIYPASGLTAEQISEFDFQHVAIATGARWRKDGIGRTHWKAVSVIEGVNVYTPDDVMHDTDIYGSVLIYDDDHYYMASLIAEKLATQGNQVCVVTTAAELATWTRNTMEQHRFERRLDEFGVKCIVKSKLHSIAKNHVGLVSLVNGRTKSIAVDAVVMVTSRIPNAELFASLQAQHVAEEHTNFKSLTRIGDALAPGIIATAVYDGHRYAREFDVNLDPDVTPFAREYTAI